MYLKNKSLSSINDYQGIDNSLLSVNSASPINSINDDPFLRYKASQLSDEILSDQPSTIIPSQAANAVYNPEQVKSETVIIPDVPLAVVTPVTAGTPVTVVTPTASGSNLFLYAGIGTGILFLCSYMLKQGGKLKWI